MKVREKRERKREKREKREFYCQKENQKDKFCRQFEVLFLFLFSFYSLFILSPFVPSFYSLIFSFFYFSFLSSHYLK